MNYQADRLIECVSETCCNSALTKDKRKSELRNILTDADTIIVMSKIKPASLPLAVCILPIKWEKMCLCVLSGEIRKNQGSRSCDMWF